MEAVAVPAFTAKTASSSRARDQTFSVVLRKKKKRLGE